MHRTFFSVVVFAALNLGVIDSLYSRADEQAEAGNSQQSEKATPNEESVEQAKQQFTELDKDGDGKLTLEDFAVGTEGDARALKRWQFFSSDGNDDQRLDLKEYLAKGQGVRLTPLSDFRRHDGNADGQVPLDELLAFESQQNHQRLRRRLTVLDFDGNGSLSEDEFLATPGWLPPEERPAIPDPLADLRQKAFDAWQTLRVAADGDGDGALSQREWPAAKLAAAVPVLAEVEFAVWDQDGNGRVDEADAKRLLDLAYGFTRPDGKPLRTPAGRVLNWYYIRALDSDHDGFLSQKEFVPRFTPDKQKSAATFAKQDADGDKRLSNDEAEPLFWSDALGSLFAADTDMDGFISQQEIVKNYPWLAASFAERAVPAFDADGDGKLSFYEYRTTPFMNMATTWSQRRTDADHDGRLSWKEYYLEKPPLMIGLNRLFFDRFDRDQDGFLSLSELEFTVNYAKLRPEVALGLHDRNADGKAQLEELFTEKKPSEEGDALERYQRLLTEAQERFKATDGDNDGALDAKEFVAWRQAEAEAAQRAAQELARQQAKQQFTELDKDGDGKLTLEDFAVGTEGDARALKRWQFFSSDGNDDQRLDLKEYLAKGQGVRLTPLSDFRRHDGNADGQVPLDELLAFESQQNHQRLRRRLTVLDFDGNGSLSEDEFLATPGWLPPEERPAIPDPLADLRQKAFDAWQTLRVAADGDGDGALSQREWPAAKLAAAVPVLAEVEFAVWDQDGNGRVDEADAKRLLDLAYGFTRPDGKPLRTPAGRVLNWYYIRALDSDHDGFLSQKEFVPRFTPDKQKSAATFAKQDADGDKRLSNDEAEPLFWSDALGSLFAADTDMDGFISQQEIVKNYPWLAASFAERAVPAFDADGDGKLSFYEYRTTPFMNMATTWSQRRTDADHDGRLSWKEYYLEKPPLMIGLNRLFFDRFDRDQDGFLSLSELEFTVNYAKLRPEVALGLHDRNADGKAQLEELFTEKKPSEEGDALERYQRLLTEAQERFKATDGDNDGALDAKEFVAWRQAEAEAAQRAAQELARQQAKQQFTELDKDGDGKLTLEDFAVGTEGDARALKRWQFFSSDGNDDQRLDLKEYLAKGQGVRLTPLSDFRRHDGNADGQVPLDELLAFESQQNHQRLRRRLTVLDFDGNGSLSEDEFLATPGWLPPEERPAIPDPLADLRQKAFDAWQTLRVAADGDGDGALSQREWPAAKLAAAVPVLAEVEFAVWDQDGNGRVDEADAKRLLDLAYGFTRPDGKPLRTPAGRVLNWYYIRALDSDHDGFLSQKEFVPRFTPDKQKSAATFAKQDADGDKRLSNDEAEPLFWSDALGSLFAADTDMDGFISQQEIVKNYPWLAASFAERAVPAFDADGDGKLSFYEYRTTPFMNMATTWSQRRTDADHDGRLSWKEYYLEKPPLMIGLNRLFFDRFDRNQDGFLSLTELEFTVDFMKAPPEIGFQAKDEDGDGKLTLAEVFAEKKPADGDQRAMDRYEMRLAHAESRFLSDDKDGNGYLDLEELVQSQESAMEAARRHSKVLARRKTSLEGNYWVRKGVLVVNEIAFLAGVWMLLRRMRRSEEPAPAPPAE